MSCPLQETVTVTTRFLSPAPVHADGLDGEEPEAAVLVFPDVAAGRRCGSHLVPLHMLPSV